MSSRCGIRGRNYKEDKNIESSSLDSDGKEDK